MASSYGQLSNADLDEKIAQRATADKLYTLERIMRCMQKQLVKSSINILVVDGTVRQKNNTQEELPL